jgi:hypothetical protein
VASIIFGRIVELHVQLPDPQGVNCKYRPYIVITRTADINLKNSIDLVAITTSFAYPLPEDHVEIPYGPKGRCYTRRDKPSAAVCSWHYRVPFSWINAEKSTGFVDGTHLEQIASKVAQFAPLPIRIFAEEESC